METVSISSLAVGKYTIQEYERISTRFGFTYILTAKSDENKLVKFWGNKYLNSYISVVKPCNEFEINIEKNTDIIEGIGTPYPNKVTIPNYSTKVVLKHK